MLLKLVPFLAVTLTLTALTFTTLWPSPQTEGLYAPAHRTSVFF